MGTVMGSLLCSHRGSSFSIHPIFRNDQAIELWNVGSITRIRDPTVTAKPTTGSKQRRILANKKKRPKRQSSLVKAADETEKSDKNSDSFSTTTVVMRAHESLFCWSQRALPTYKASHDAFMTLPPHITGSREDYVRSVVEGARTGRADGTTTRTQCKTCCTVGSHQYDS
jgi:hypothetical protein